MTVGSNASSTVLQEGNLKLFMCHGDYLQAKNVQWKKQRKTNKVRERGHNCARVGVLASICFFPYRIVAPHICLVQENTRD